MIINHRDFIDGLAEISLGADIGDTEKKIIRSVFRPWGSLRHLRSSFQDLTVGVFRHKAEMGLLKGRSKTSGEEVIINAPEYTQRDGGSPFLDFLQWIINTMIENEFEFLIMFLTEVLPLVIEIFTQLFQKEVEAMLAAA